MLNEELIDDDTYQYLNVTSARPGRFYMLPKIHKKGIPGRPICSSNKHPTERISEFVDHHIRKYVTELPSHIRDTQHFIKKLKEIEQLPIGSLLVTMDVTSLYTNIPNKEGIDAVLHHIRRDHSAKIQAQKIGKLLELVLHCNHFEFNNKLYLQIGGTAMGTRVAPSLANLFLGRFEEQLLKNVPCKPRLWRRFIDDIFMIWTHGEDKLNEFVEYTNNQHPTIKVLVSGVKMK
jgi:hypothetical protein